MTGSSYKGMPERSVRSAYVECKWLGWDANNWCKVTDTLKEHSHIPEPSLLASSLSNLSFANQSSCCFKHAFLCRPIPCLLKYLWQMSHSWSPRDEGLPAIDVQMNIWCEGNIITVRGSVQEAVAQQVARVKQRPIPMQFQPLIDHGPISYNPRYRAPTGVQPRYNRCRL